MRPGQDELIPTRVSLLNRLRDWHDQAGWQEFFDTYWRLIYGVARQAGLTDVEAQDAVQETLIAVARHIPTFCYDPARGSFKAWLLIQTRWRITDQLRKRGLATVDPRPSDGTTLDALEQVADPASVVPEAIWEAQWRENLLASALEKVKRRLDPEKYQLFDFYVNKEWPAAKVAQRFRVSIDRVYLAKHRITELIKAEVARLERQTT